ncbi:hypothetical protein OHA40_08165 [Nocardia sp. NBC_00508]|uniref:hypothetical protein n=1 Tax=Nocardia sp. NBC_00508 TaxID=2975992 RepID=UPI002E814E19|nr:hypothetical protein [Nocardia sp. NBC_00508]WUD68077.1 hypothetical protein OHA40_08165 [Nocardia sp. NBC_00508]
MDGPAAMQVNNELITAIRRAADDVTRALVDCGTPALAGVMRQTSGRLQRTMDELGHMDHSLGTQLAAYAEPRGSTGNSSRREGDGFAWFQPRLPRSERINREIDDCLTRVNPHFDSADPRRSNNCVAVATAYELRRRGYDVEAGQVPFPFEAGFPHSIAEIAWARRFTAVFQRSHLHEVFRQPGSRGIVIADWPPGQRVDLGDSHVFNIEHVPGTGIRVVDGQPTPPLTDATKHIREAAALRYLRVDDLADPAPSIVNYLGIHTARQ